MAEGMIIALLGFAGAVLGAAIAGFAGIAKAGIEGKSESRFSCGLLGVLIALGAAVGIGLGVLIVSPALSPRPSLTQSAIIAETRPQPTQLPNSACIMPMIEGLDQSAAEGLITQLGLRIVKSAQYNAEIVAGRIISQNPKAATKLDPCDGDVTIVVSLGLVPTPVFTNTPKPTDIPAPTNTPEPSPGGFYNFDSGDLTGWEIQGDGQAEINDGKLVLIGYGAMVVVGGSKTWRDYSIKVKVKYISGRNDFSIAVRVVEVDQAQYSMQYDGGELRITRNDGGNNWTKLATIPFNIEKGKWYNVQVDIRGTEIVCYINGAKVLSVEDGAYSAGRFSLRSNQSQMFFDNLEIVPLP